MGGDHMCPVCSATFTRPQHVARHMRSHTGDRPYACQTCGDRFARSDLLSRHVNKCHTPGGLANTTRKGARNQSAASEDKKRRPCDECAQHSTKCDFGRPSCNNCSSRGSKCSYPRTKRARRNTNPSPSNHPNTLPEHNVSLSHEPMPINSFGHYQEDIQPFHFHYQPPDSSISMPPMFDNGMSLPNPGNTFIGSPEAPSLSFSAATSESADSSSPWNGMDLIGLNNMPSQFDGNVFPDPNAPSYTSTHKYQTSMGSPFNYNIEPQEQSQIPLTALHQRSASASYGRHPIQHHQRHRSSPSLDGSHPLLNHALMRAQGQQYPSITPTRLYMHRGSLSASDSGTDYESPARPGTAGEYTDFPSPMSLVNSESGSTTGIGRSIDDMALQDPGAGSLLPMGSMMVPGIGMGTGLTPAGESPTRPMMTQRQSTLGDLKAFWNECLDNQNSSNGESRAHSLSKMTSMPCLKTPMGDATPRAAAADPLARLNQQRPLSRAGQTPRVGQSDTKGLEQYRSALNALPAPSLRMAPKMKAAVAKQEESESINIKSESPFSAPFAPGSAQDDAWRSLMSSTGSYVVEPTGRPNYKRLPSQTLGPENSKRIKDGDDSSVFTDDEEDEDDTDYKQSQEWHRRMSLPVMGRSGAGASRLHQPQPVPVPGGRQGTLN
ncbi:fungal Zn, 2-cys(6) binuclear cluster domain protein [Rhizoctonia solani 123E]|uniref:Fungal Zn, 2-cys(6) binuclear cluster domain protein n=1 Tax=Rhizoctonia solani 123E TaxID=1423351 RepID=A0A074SQM0_9AGAM|nr:fungal Zn, 2-cys(6) binuclear cluster domain protein [Rhizoctonia solani 123E]